MKDDSYPQHFAMAFTNPIPHTNIKELNLFKENIL